MQKQNNIYFFDTFSQFPELIHGFSTRPFGSMRPSHPSSQEALKSFAESAHINPAMIVQMGQVHGSNIEWVGLFDVGSKIAQTDGLLTTHRNVSLTVVTADCIPIFLFDISKKYIGVVHAGWRGLYKQIIEKAISTMITEGSFPSDIIVGIGPCIRSCCYVIDEERASLFKRKFKKTQDEPLGYIINNEDKIFLNLPYLARLQLLEAGILDENIEDSGICTADTISDFYSYRKEGENFGEFVGIIGRK